MNQNYNLFGNNVEFEKLSKFCTCKGFNWWKIAVLSEIKRSNVMFIIECSELNLGIIWNFVDGTCKMSVY